MTASSLSTVASERVSSPFHRREPASEPPGEPASEPPGEPVSEPVSEPAAESALAAAPEPAPRALTLRPMTGYEEEYLEAAAADPDAARNTARLCNGLLARCSVAAGENPAEALEVVRGLRVAERDRALLELRRRSLGDQVKTEVDCPACGETNEVDFDLASVPLAESGGTPAEAGGTEPLAVALAGDRTARLRLPTAGDQEALLDAPPTSAAERRTRLLARLLLEFDGETGPFADAAVHALATGDRRALEQAIDEASEQQPLDMVVDCCECGASFTSPFDAAVFFCLS